MADTQTTTQDSTQTDNSTQVGTGAGVTDGTASKQDQTTDSTDLGLGVDVTKLTPELQQVYKSMQSGFTKKMQELAEDKRLAAEYRKLQDEQKLQQDTGKQVEGDVTDDEFVEAFSSKDKFIAFQKKLLQSGNADLQKRLNETRQMLEVREAERIIETFATAKDDKGNDAHPLYAELEALGLIDFRNEPPTTTDKYPEVIDKVYRRAVDTYNKIYSKGKEVGLGRVQEKVNSSSEIPTSVKQVEGEIDFKNSSPDEQVREAVRRARLKLGVK